MQNYLTRITKNQPNQIIIIARQKKQPEQCYPLTSFYPAVGVEAIRIEKLTGIPSRFRSSSVHGGDEQLSAVAARAGRAALHLADLFVGREGRRQAAVLAWLLGDYLLVRTGIWKNRIDFKKNNKQSN